MLLYPREEALCLTLDPSKSNKVACVDTTSFFFCNNERRPEEKLLLSISVFLYEDVFFVDTAIQTEIQQYTHKKCYRSPLA